MDSKHKGIAKTTLHLDPALHKRLRLLAIERGTTFGVLVTEALEQYLRRQARPRRRARP